MTTLPKCNECFILGVRGDNINDRYYSRYGSYGLGGLTSNVERAKAFSFLSDVAETIEQLIQRDRVNVDDVFITRKTIYVDEEDVSVINTLALFSKKPK